MMSGIYEKRWLQERGLAGWMERNVKPMLPVPEGPVTLPAVVKKITQYTKEPDEKAARESAKYFAEALRDCGLSVQAAQPSYQGKNLDELCARIEKMSKEVTGDKSG
jgi:hypothetical protein